MKNDYCIDGFLYFRGNEDGVPYCDETEFEKEEELFNLSITYHSTVLNVGCSI